MSEIFNKILKELPLLSGKELSYVSDSNSVTIVKVDFDLKVISAIKKIAVNGA